jgi:hypothetical protein
MLVGIERGGNNVKSHDASLKMPKGILPCVCGGGEFNDERTV